MHTFTLNAACVSKNLALTCRMYILILLDGSISVILPKPFKEVLTF